ncbi:extracellular ribonuclease-like [Zingiber officinale]|uniref:extracellular ribonuclease-like n=1 Tax=Zingiber officinale TaxID=94328 RepID=UPI001C4CB92E|nr:extracellular ribonuclease-like [Zingiber officinale]
MSTFLLPAQTLAFPANPSSSLVRRSSTLASTIGVIKASSAPRSKPVLPAPLEASRFPLRGILLASIVGFACALTFNSAVTATIYPCEDVDRYYTGVDGLQGAALMKKLNSIVSAHQSLRYKDIWYALKILDAADFENPEASSEIVEIYSLRAVPKSLAGKSEGWNREHLWPRSYGLTNGPMLTDLHNIHPADANVNSSRGNKYYGECVATSAHCSRPANNEAAADTETDKERWAPPKEVKGDVARSVMYMAVSYGFQQPNGSPPLRLSDSPNIETNEMGLLSTLLQWNELDPPSSAEKLRNDRICKLYQHNRNPFIDHPEYANLIWKYATNEGKGANKGWAFSWWAIARTRMVSVYKGIESQRKRTPLTSDSCSYYYRYCCC